MFPFPLTVLGEVADRIHLESLIKPALVGVTYDAPQYTVSPEGAEVYNVTYAITLPTGSSQVSATGRYTPISEGPFSVTITAENRSGKTLRNTSSAYAYQLSVTLPEPVYYVEPARSELIGETILPTSAINLEGLKIAYTSTDDSVVQVSPFGRWYSVAEGVCQIGCTVTYKNISVSATADFHVVTEAMRLSCEYRGQEVGAGAVSEVYMGGPEPEGLEVTNLQIIVIGTPPSGWGNGLITYPDYTFKCLVTPGAPGTYSFYVQGLNASGVLITSPIMTLQR